MQNSFQGDSKVVEMMIDLGVSTSFQPKKIQLTKNNQKPSSLFFDLNDQPDLAPALFCSCAGNSRKASFSGIGHLKYKESNREEALQTELSKCGIDFERKDDALILKGIFQRTTVPFQTYKDHRMAMAFAPLALINGELVVDNPDVVKKSYPEYWNDLKRLGFEIKAV
jgi:3-phosphoshikimate 1-carboxyvinyltransferase